MEGNRMRNLTVADGCCDAPCHRMKRLESWPVFIDAEHLASNLLASDFHDAIVYYHFFPISEIRSPHLLPVSPGVIDRRAPQSRFHDLGMSPALRAAERRAAHYSREF